MYKVVSLFPKLGEETALITGSAFNGFGQLPIARPTAPHLNLGTKPKCPECPTCPECPVQEGCPECAECVCADPETCICPDPEECVCPEVKSENVGGGIAWWWLLVAGSAGVGIGFGAAKMLAKKP